jgi:phosphoserine phosphatase RsbU/P
VDDDKDPIHPLLARQLRRAGIDLATERERDSRFGDLIRRVSASYFDNDSGRYLLERSLELSSRELLDLNRLLDVEKRRLAGELGIAMRLQTSILPHDVRTSEYEAAGQMVPATEVGGDYYDIIPIEDGCWLGIGDVVGHGLRAAVVMTMVQAMVSALVRRSPRASPRELVVTLNEAVHENLATRLNLLDHVTLTLVHCQNDGRVTFAGAHEAMIVYRSEERRCAEIHTPGTWLGPLKDIAHATTDNEISLAPHDLLVLYTDGVTEARNESHEQFGLQRLTDLVSTNHLEPLSVQCQRIMTALEAWSDQPEDDRTTVFFRRLHA